MGRYIIKQEEGLYYANRVYLGMIHDRLDFTQAYSPEECENILLEKLKGEYELDFNPNIIKV
jgi:hypothetical protein